jgi:hypothetical protein
LGDTVHHFVVWCSVRDFVMHLLGLATSKETQAARNLGAGESDYVSMEDRRLMQERSVLNMYM